MILTLGFSYSLDNWSRQHWASSGWLVWNHTTIITCFFLVRFARTWSGLGQDLVGLESHNYHKMLKKNLFIGFTETRPCGYCIIRARVQIFWHSLGGHTQLLIYTH